MVVFIVMPMKAESDRVGEAVAHSFCSHSRKKNGTRLFGREANFLTILSRSLNHGGDYFVKGRKKDTFLFV